MFDGLARLHDTTVVLDLAFGASFLLQGEAKCGERTHEDIDEVLNGDFGYMFACLIGNGEWCFWVYLLVTGPLIICKLAT